MPLSAHLAVWAGGGRAWLRRGSQGWGLRWAEGRRGAQCHETNRAWLGPCIPPEWCGGPGLRSEVHPRQPRPGPRVRRRLLSAEQCELFEGLGSRGWVFLQTQGLLCKTGFDSQARRPQVPVGRQAGAGGFVWQEEGPWKLRNKARDRAGWGCRPAWADRSGLGCQWGKWTVCLGPAPFQPGSPRVFLASSHGGSSSLTYTAGAVGPAGCHGGPLVPKISV